MKIIVSGGWSYGNMGDEIIAKSTINLLNKHFPNTKITYLSFNIIDFYNHHLINSIKSIHKRIVEKNLNIKKFDYEYILKHIEVNDYLELFNDKDVIFIMSGGGYFFEEWKEQFYSRLIEIYLAKKYNAKIILIGQSIGPIYTKKSLKLISNALNLCDFISVRDNDSFNFLNSLNLNIKINYSPDLATSYNYKKINKKDVINIMFSSYSKYRSIYSKPLNKYLNKLYKKFSISKIIYIFNFKKILKKLSSNYNIRFILSVNWKWDYDIISKLNHKFNFEIIYPTTINDFLNYIGEGKFLISTKMHPIIISSGYNIPSIAISYDYKIDNFMKSVNAEKFCFKNNNINSKKIIELIENYYDKNIDYKFENFNESINKMFEEIKIIIKK